MNYADEQSEDIDEPKISELLQDLGKIDEIKLQQKELDDDLIITKFDQKSIAPVELCSVLKQSALIKTEFNKVPEIKPQPMVVTQTKTDLIKTDYAKSSHLKLPDKKPEPIVCTEKKTNLIKTDYTKSSNLKLVEKIPEPIVSLTKTTEMLKTDYHYVQTKQDDEQIEMEKIDKEDEPSTKKLRLRMPLSRTESILVRQAQIEGEQQDISDSFDVKLVTSDDETPSPESLVLKRKSIGKQQSNQISELSDEFNLNEIGETRKCSVQSDQSEYAEASDDIIEQADDEKLKESANVVRKKSVRFQSPDVVKSIKLFTPGSSQENDFYDADDDANFNQEAIQDLIHDQLKGSENDENNFDRVSLNTLVEQTKVEESKSSTDDKSKESVASEIELEYPPELLELMSKPFVQLTEKEKSKLKKLKDKYDEKLRKLKEKQEAKLKKEQEKARKKAEDEEKKAEKARKKEEEKLKKLEEKARKEEEKKLKKLKEDEDKKAKKSKDAKTNNLENLKSESKDLEIKEVEQCKVEQQKPAEEESLLKNEDSNVATIEKTDDLQQNLCQGDDDLPFVDKATVDTLTILEDEQTLKPEKAARTKKLSKKLSPKEEKTKDTLEDKPNEKLEDEFVRTTEDSESLKFSNEDLSTSTNNNLLEMESIRGLSPTAKLNNKLFKKSTSIEDDTEMSSAIDLRQDNLPLIILPQKDKSATLDDRLLRRHKSPKLTSVEQLDFHHLDNVGCLDSSIKNYFNNFVISDNLSDLKDLSKYKREHKERRSISPTSLKLHNLSLPSANSQELKRHTFSAKRTPPVRLDNLRAQLSTLSNAELSFFASQIKENKLKPPATNQFEIINKSLLSALHHSSELSVSTPCLSQIIRPQPAIKLPLVLSYVPSSINRHLSSRIRASAIQKLSPIQMPLLNIPFDFHLKTESMPSLSRFASVNRPLIRHSIRTTARTSSYQLYKDSSDVYYRDTIYQLKRIEEQLNRLKRQFDSTANLSMMDAKACLSRTESRRLPELPSTTTTYKYHCSINLVKEDLETKPVTEDIHSEPSRTKVYFRIYKRLGCSHVGSRDLTSKIKEHEDEFRAFCPPYVCVLCYYTVISIHYLMKQGYEMGEAIEMVKRKQDKEKEEKWKHRSSVLIDSRNRLNLNYLPSRSSSQIKDFKYENLSNVCHQATTHLNHHQHYSYERSHKPQFYCRDQYLSYKSSTLDDRPKSPSSLRLLDCSSPTSAVNKNACKSLYHSSLRTNYSNNRFQSDYMKRKSKIDPFLKDTNLRKAEIIWKSKNNL